MAAVNTLGVDIEIHRVSHKGRGTAAAFHVYNDPNVLFEEYLHYATITRAEEKEDAASAPKEKRSFKSTLKNRFSTGNQTIDRNVLEHQSSLPPTLPNDEKHEEGEVKVLEESPDFWNRVYNHPNEVSDVEWKVLSRGVRTVSWSTCFYLITSDIMGPSSVPWAFAQLGYGPGITLFTIFGGLGSLSGYYIWAIFTQMDSNRYPLRDFGGAFFRVFGPTSRHIINIMQSVQMILTVASLILGMGQSIAQVSAGTSKPVCFVVCLLIFTLLGMVLGQVRTLQRFGWLANFAVWMNLMVVFISMGVAANSPPNFSATEASFGSNFAEGPIVHYAGLPPAGGASGGDGMIATFNGINQAVYGYAGAILFFNFLSEMRHPWDFWKSIICAQVFIYVCYMFFGLFIYSYQGQFAFNPVQQGLSIYSYQTAANICYIMTGFIAAAMYGNIGIKIIYINVFQEIFGAPSLTKKGGKIAWVVMVPAYWAIAFVIGASVPQFSYISGLLSAVCMLTFTYSFPALLHLGFRIKKAAMLPEESFDEITRTYIRVDSGMQRWRRGFMVHWLTNTVVFIYFLGTLTVSGLGTWSSIEGLIDAFSGTSVATSWGCVAPI